MIINLATKNKEKIAIAKAALNNTDIQLKIIDIECIEIQSDDSEKIAKFSSKYLSDLLKKSIVKIDSGLYIEALNGFPATYSEYIEKKLNEKYILKMMKGEENRKAFYKESLSYCEYGKEPIVFTTYTKGTITENINSTDGYPFDKIFICNGDTQTMSNFNIYERSIKYSHENWKSLYNYLKLGGN